MELSTILSEIRHEFLLAANPADAAPMRSYMKDIAPFFGVKATGRRLIQKEFFKEYRQLPTAVLQQLIKALYHEQERELHLMATEWLYDHRTRFAAGTIRLIEWLITHKSWWDTVDFLSARVLGYWAERFPGAAAPELLRFIQSDNLWLNRAAIIHQLHYGSRTDKALLEQAIMPHLGSKEFFHQKAIGWALRQYARTNPEWVRRFAETHPLPSLSRREALRHI